MPGLLFWLCWEWLLLKILMKPKALIPFRHGHAPFSSTLLYIDTSSYIQQRREPFHLQNFGQTLTSLQANLLLLSNKFLFQAATKFNCMIEPFLASSWHNTKAKVLILFSWWYRAINKYGWLLYSYRWNYSSEVDQTPSKFIDNGCSCLIVL